MPDDASTQIGRLAVERGFATQADIDLCLKVQAQLGGRHNLGALLVHRGLVTDAQLRELLDLLEMRKSAPSAAPAARPVNSLSARPAAISSPGRPARTSAPPPPPPPPADDSTSPELAPVQFSAPLPPARPSAPPRPAAISAPPPSAPVSVPPAASRIAPAGGPGAARILSILEAAEKRGASDVHFHPGSPLALRTGGRLLTGTTALLDARELDGQLRELLTPDQRARFDTEMSFDLLCTTPSGLRARGNLYVTNTGTNATFRLVRRTAPSLAELGLPEQLASFVEYAQGMVLVTGLAGSGKTSTLAALVNLIAQERAEHILCLEDPVEILHSPKMALVNQRQVGRDTNSFARALRGALREDPDVIVVGDLRDAETISLAVTAAETGHLVLGSMNTASAVRAISRILGAFPPAQQTQVRSMVSESLHGVITQRLVPTIDGGRAIALELLVITPAIGNLIRDDKMFQVRSAMQTGKSQGMRTMDDSLRELVLSGRVAPDEARRVAENPALIPNGPGKV